MLDPERSLQLFLSAFTARDVAESLASFDDTTSLSVIRQVIENQRLEVVGIRRSGIVSGWLSMQDVLEDRPPAQCRPFDNASVIDEVASLNEVVRALNGATCLFVRSFGEIGGFICRSHLQKPAMRMWLFGLVTVSELRVTRMIDELCPNDSWQVHLSEGRLQKARELQHERSVRGQNRSLLECLQFTDKGQIVSREESLRQRTRFASKREVEKFVKSLQDLRNNLAHSQDISGDWEVIHDLATNLHRIVLGPSSPNESR